MNLETENELNSHATLQDVESAVGALNGSDRSLLSVELDSGALLTIGGGPEFFVVEIDYDGVHRWAVVDPHAADRAVDLVVGGQLVDFPARLCVPRASAVDAVRTFVNEHGGRCPRLAWSVET